MSTPKVIEFTSPDSPTVLYACGLCGFTTATNERAASCCLCVRCQKPVEARFSTMCQDCSADDHRARQAQRRAKAMERPVVEHDGPVWVADTEHFYDYAQAAAEALYDDGIDPTTALVHPCHEGKVPVPDLHSYVDEAWGEEFEDGFYDGLSRKADEAITVCVKALEACAPTCWTPNERQRVTLPTLRFVTP